MKKNILWLSLIIVFICSNELHSQGGSAFGVKGGPLLGFQTWNSNESELLFRYSGIAYIETYSPDAKYSLFAQSGFHVRGGALRIRGGSFQAINSAREIIIPTQSYPYEFRNVSLSIGAKQRFGLDEKTAWYYLLGVRGEYTLSDNLDEYQSAEDPGIASFNLIHPFPGSNVRRWNYGIIAGAGIDFMFSELVGALVELTISPDFSQQYFSPPFTFNSPFNGGQTISVQERSINNISIELSVGFRFLRIVEYVNHVY